MAFKQLYSSDYGCEIKGAQTLHATYQHKETATCPQVHNKIALLHSGGEWIAQMKMRLVKVSGSSLYLLSMTAAAPTGLDSVIKSEWVVSVSY